MPSKKVHAPPTDAKVCQVKVGICNRLVKEVAHYTKETEANVQRIQKMRDDGKDKYDLKKADEILEETRLMIPDTERRLAEAVNDLFTFMQEHDENAEVRDCKDFEKATALLEEYDAMVTD